MPTPPESDGPKYVGRIVDPLPGDEREDDLEVPAGAGHPVRERLLTRARAAQERHHGGSRDRDEPAPLSTRHNVDRAPAGSTRTPYTPSLSRRRRQLSPSLRALFATLMGLAVIATFVAVGMNLKNEENLSLYLGANKVTAPSAQTSATLPPPVPSRSAPPPSVPAPWRITDAKADPGLRIVRGTFKNQPFLGALQAAGIDLKQAYRALTAFKGVRDLNRCGPSHEFIALIERGPGVLKAFEYIESKESVFQAKQNESGFLVGAKLDLQVRREQTRGVLLLTGSDFAPAAKQAGFDPSLKQVLEEALQGHFRLDEIDFPASVRVAAQEVTVAGVFSRYSGIEAAEIKQVNGESLRIYYFRGERSKGYFDAKGRSFFEGGWRKPIPGAAISSPFNPKRMHPVLHKVMPHNGTDFGAPMGEPVYAASFGTVKSIGPGGPSGNLVVLSHAGEIETGYAHLSRFAEGLKVGDRVKRLQLVGYVGNTGRSTGPHLHFSVKKHGVFVDSATLLLDGLTTLPNSEQSAFDETRRTYDALLDSIPLPALPAATVQPPTAKSAGTEAAPKPAELDATGASYDEGELGSVEATPATAAAALSLPAPPIPPPPAAEPAPGTVAPASAPNAVYLTDSELIKLQSATADGQVDP